MVSLQSFYNSILFSEIDLALFNPRMISMNTQIYVLSSHSKCISFIFPMAYASTNNVKCKMQFLFVYKIVSLRDSFETISGLIENQLT